MLKKDSNEIKNELEEMSSVLSDLKKTVPFTIPENYFAEMRSDLKRELDIKPVSSPAQQDRPGILDLWNSFWNTVFTPRLIPAYATVAVLVIATFIWQQNKGESVAGQASVIESEVVDYFVNNDLEEFDDTELLDLLTEEEVNDFLNDVNSQAHIDIFIESHIDDLDIELLEEEF